MAALCSGFCTEAVYEVSHGRKKKALDFAAMLMQPDGDRHPSKEMVFQTLTGLFHVDLSFLDDLTEEEFVCSYANEDIHGSYYKNPAKKRTGCAILVHGYAQNRYIMLPQMKLFLQLGLDVVLFDQRAFGVSREPYGTFGAREAEDVTCIIRWAKNRMDHDGKIVLLGVSMGAATVLNALALTDEMDYVIADCGFTSLENGLNEIYMEMYQEENPYLTDAFWELEAELRQNHPKQPAATDRPYHAPANAAAKSNVPLCIIHGDADTTISVNNARELYAAAKNAAAADDANENPRREVRLEIFEGKGHALAITDENRYLEILKDFCQ